MKEKINHYLLETKYFFKNIGKRFRRIDRTFKQIHKKAAAQDASEHSVNRRRSIRSPRRYSAAAYARSTSAIRQSSRARKPVPATARTKATPGDFTGKTIFSRIHAKVKPAIKTVAVSIRPRLENLKKWAPIAVVSKFLNKTVVMQMNKLSKQSRVYVTAGFALLFATAAIVLILPAGRASAETLSVDTPGVLTAAAIEAAEPIAYYSAEPGLSAPIVIDIQQRLMDLGYMAYDEPSDYYGDQTVEAVKLFQRKYGLEITGVADETTFGLLFSKSAEPYSVSEGVEGNDVKELQERLVELDYLKEEATGVYDAATTEAVKRFQERNGLAVDGAIGQDTREALYSEEAKANAFAYGEQSEEIKQLQQRLKDLGYLTTTPDGKYGSDTVAAVRRFQNLNGLIADGYLGSMTKSILLSGSAQYNSIAIGDSGNDVTRIQERLIELGYMKKATGYFGSSTEDALISFQKRNNLTADGKFGVNTNTVLFSSDAKKAPVTTTKNNSSSSGSKSNSSSNSGSSGKTANVSGANVASLISVAESRLGCRYVLGAKGPNQFDCSGFVYWCLNKVGVSQGYMTSFGWRTTSKYQRITSMSDIQAGDIIVYKISGSQGHVAIAVSSDTMIDASSSKDAIVKRSFQTSYWQKYFYCAYRIF